MQPDMSLLSWTAMGVGHKKGEGRGYLDITQGQNVYAKFFKVVRASA
jgi:hypothetical protein